MKSDAAGCVQLDDPPTNGRPFPIYARHEQRKLVAVQVIGEELPRKISLTMQRECCVTGHISCRELEKRGRKLNWPIHGVLVDGIEFLGNLEFWGYWCGPCVRRGLPQMFAIQEEYRDKPLAIIGVHVDDEDSVTLSKQLHEKLKYYRENVWNGKDITFPNALTVPKRTPFITGVEKLTGRGTKEARAAVSADYGILMYPTTVLIDASGIVVGRFDPGDPKDLAKLKKLLDSE